eukprot:1268926-Rhodomonas_salina.1
MNWKVVKIIVEAKLDTTAVGQIEVASEVWVLRCALSRERYCCLFNNDAAFSPIHQVSVTLERHVGEDQSVALLLEHAWPGHVNHDVLSSS